MENYNLVTGYVSGLIGQVTGLHAQYYSENWRFGKYFECKVATELAGFIADYDECSDRIFSILIDGKIEGSISIDGPTESQNAAHIRWFIVSDKLKGQGVGHYLMEQAVGFCKEKGYGQIYLWTFKGLESAKHVYNKFGFRLTEEKEGDQWETTVIEQRYEMNMSPKQ